MDQNHKNIPFFFLPVDDLRSHVLHRAAETESFLLEALLAQPEVCHRDVTVRVKEDILRFQVPR